MKQLILAIIICLMISTICVASGLRLNMTKQEQSYIENCFAKAYERPTTVRTYDNEAKKYNNVSNPETKSAFLKRMLTQYIDEVCDKFESDTYSSGKESYVRSKDILTAGINFTDVSGLKVR